jgi:hypothetical protein
LSQLVLDFGEELLAEASVNEASVLQPA